MRSCACICVDDTAIEDVLTHLERGSKHVLRSVTDAIQQCVTFTGACSLPDCVRVCAAFCVEFYMRVQQVLTWMQEACKWRSVALQFSTC
jgi:hypothetical protein